MDEGITGAGWVVGALGREGPERWKLGLRVQGVGAPLPTKIECSRRGPGVSPAALHGQPYDTAAALRQKIGALAGRQETQARDVFDLHHLLARGAALRGLADQSESLAARSGLFRSLPELPPG